MTELRWAINSGPQDGTKWISKKRQTHSLFLTCASRKLPERWSSIAKCCTWEAGSGWEDHGLNLYHAAWPSSFGLSDSFYGVSTHQASIVMVWLRTSPLQILFFIVSSKFWSIFSLTPKYFFLNFPLVISSCMHRLSFFFHFYKLMNFPFLEVPDF